MDERPGELTARERQVIYLLARGFTASESARILGDSDEQTIHQNRGAAKRKLGARTLPQLVHLCDQRPEPLLDAASLAWLQARIDKAHSA